tara:strand:- start:137 stop:487 length:351 start_codon:yes stop_codon:yes gene_type:complete
MSLEMEIVFTLITLCSVVGFMMGNLISPSTRFAKKEIQYWRGLTGDFKKQLKSEKRQNSGDLDSLLDGELSIGKLFKVAKNLKPEDIEGIKGLIGQITTNQKQLDNNSDSDIGRLR